MPVMKMTIAKKRKSLSKRNAKRKRPVTCWDWTGLPGAFSRWPKSGRNRKLRSR